MMRSTILFAVFLLSGVFTALAFPPYELGWLIWVSLAPALVATVHSRFSHALFGGFLFGTAVTGMLLYWLTDLFGFGGVGLILICGAVFSLFFGALWCVAWRFGTHATIWAAPVLWVGVEFFRSECWWLKFTWMGLGYSQYENTAFLQTASIGGVYLLSFFIVLANGSLASVLESFRFKRVAALVTTVLLILFLHGLGRAIPDPVPGEVPIAGVEGEFPLSRHFADKTEEVMKSHPETKLVIWPEYSKRETLTKDHEVYLSIQKLSAHLGVPILFGGKRPEEDSYENTLFLMRPDGSVSTQAKSVPIQFFDDGLPAKSRTPMALGEETIGAAICYDMDYPYISRELAMRGAGLLIYPTMDVLDWGNVEHVQHASLTAFRAVEHRRWVVRVASSGISKIVDPYGRTMQETSVGGPVVMRGNVSFAYERTVYTKWGYFFPHGCLGLTLLLLLLAGVRLSPVEEEEDTATSAPQ